jgi:hypothetical protein
MANAKTYALYLEMVKDVRGSQVLLIPPIYNPLTGTTSRASIYTRKISEAHPRRSWNKVVVRKNFDADPTLTAPSTISLTEAVAPAVDEFGNFFVGMVSGRWKMTKPPVTIEMSFDDMRDLEADKTPNALIRRVLKARAEAGYPETVWPVPVVEAPEPVVEVAAEEYLTVTGTPVGSSGPREDFTFVSSPSLVMSGEPTYTEGTPSPDEVTPTYTIEFKNP